MNYSGETNRGKIKIRSKAIRKVNEMRGWATVDGINAPMNGQQMFLHDRMRNVEGIMHGFLSVGRERERRTWSDFL